MAKFGRLIQNEYIKMLKKVSTIIMLVLIVIGTLAYGGISLIAKYSISTMDEYYYYGTSAEVDAENEMENLKQQLAAAQDEVDRASIQNSIDRLQFTIDNDLLEPVNDWRSGAVRMLFDTMSDPAFAQLSDTYVADKEAVKTAIIAKDWKTYLEINVRYTKLLGKLEGQTDEQLENATALDQYCITHNIEPNRENAGYQLVTQWVDAKSTLDEMETAIANGQTQYASPQQLEEARDTYKLLDYRVQNNIEFDVSEHTSWTQTGQFDFWSVFCGSSALCSFIGVLMMVIAGGIVASEFSQGTIKFLLINPVQRWKILASKYVTAITFGYIMMFLALIISAVISLIVSGGGNLGASYYYVSDGVVKSIPGIVHVLRAYMLSSVAIVVNATLAFSLSSLVRSTALAVGVGMGAMFGGTIVTSVLALLRLDWGRFLIFTNTNLQTIADGGSTFAGQTVPFALCIIGIHMLVFLLTAWDGFVRREV